ncbi:MAG: protein translocase subunit SecF, partial [Amoebophilaceae bacterium]|nr:protein translocase subunit SecF [Amoebophilaceae bacterium]
GLALVLLFMMAYYGKGGAVANLALGFNLLFIVGIFAQLDATLTLPGIAGLVLTIGMSIDANVLIFERIREELVHKTPIKEAIKRGYTKSYSSIIDSNITTFLVGAILYYLGQGQVKGFALILMIGIVSSIFASIFVTQLLFAYFIGNVRTTRFTFSCGIIPQSFKHISFDFIKNRFYFYAFSFLIILVGGVCCYQQKGLVLGVDFAGGRSYIVQCAHPIDSSLLKEKLAPSFEGRVEVRTYGANNVMHVTTSYLSQDYSAVADQKVAGKLIEALQGFTQSESHTQDKFTIINSSRVGAAVARDVQKSAQKAIVFALVGIFFYVVLRFRKWSFALAAVSALVHDTCIVVAGFCIAHAFGFSYEVNEVFLAAILTIIGYSINDTIVIFDRIREGLKAKNRALTIEPMLVNRSISSTLSRTLITSFTTLLTVVMLFCFGGAALRGFSFALLLGILFGTYSSICIAAPFLADLSTKRENSKLQ